ncbi:MAG: hypothetical protein ACE5Z5_13160 [Candidatus Bathyarchaeia archaeon]
MALKLRLVKGRRVLCEIPLSPREWSKDELTEELDRTEREFEDFHKLLEAMTNVNRVRMVRCLLEDDDFTMSFKEFMNGLGMNPKVIREHAMKLHRAGFLESPDRGKYRLSELGRFSCMMTGLAFRRILHILKEECETC